MPPHRTTDLGLGPIGVSTTDVNGEWRWCEGQNEALLKREAVIIDAGDGATALSERPNYELVSDPT